jgi:DNA (cytosine-5)-methyltransferase 1
MKPPYAIPTMKEIAEIKPNGFSMFSTFSGCGGSCLGYKMAGFKVLWANEFVPEAQTTYRANHKDTLLDTRDIRAVDPAALLESFKMKAGELDVLEGSPPCASFSTAGKREKHWGKVKKYSDTEQRTDDLFHEFIRLLKGIQPKTFTAENVSGLVRGVAVGMFKEFSAAFTAAGYKVKAQLLDAQWLGVPQCRQRIIFFGVRNDLPAEPDFPKPLPYRYTIREALPWIKSVEGANGYDGHAHYKADVPAATIQASRPLNVEVFDDPKDYDIAAYAIGKEWAKLHQGQQSEKYFNLVRTALDQPCPTVTASGGVNPGYASVTHPVEKRKFRIAELRRICSFPDDFVLTGSYAQQWERLGRSVPPIMMYHVAKKVQEVLARCRR